MIGIPMSIPKNKTILILNPELDQLLHKISLPMLSDNTHHMLFSFGNIMYHGFIDVPDNESTKLDKPILILNKIQDGKLVGLTSQYIVSDFAKRVYAVGSYTLTKVVHAIQ